MVEIGSIRPSQLITTFGPGSIVNLEHDTVMILGLQFWPRGTNDKKYFKKIIHPYLSRQLKTNYFKMPISDGHSSLPCISFPRWGVCQECNRLQKHPDSTTTKNGFCCKNCNSKLPLFHALFVQICDNGHIEEFPWERWAHLRELNDWGRIEKCTKSSNDEPKLEFLTRKKGTGLVNYEVKCLHCNASRTMINATDKDTFKKLGFKNCFKNQPWLGTKDRKPCNEEIYGVQVNSSLVYYPSIVTSLLIPNWIHAVDDVLDQDNGDNAIRIKADRKDGRAYELIIDYHRSGIFKELLQNYSQKDIIKRLKMRFEPTNLEISTEGESLKQEFDNFVEIKTRTIKGPDHDIKIDIEPISLESSFLSGYGVDTLLKLHRLVSIQVLRGFTRGKPPDPFATEDQINKKNPFRKISSGSQRDFDTGELSSINWLPAVETKGEGIFIKFNETKLQEWETRNKVIQRYKAMINSYAENIDAQNRADKENVLKQFNSPRYILLHTLSHLLIREIADRAGYNEASLKERIYSTFGKVARNGIMIYTSSSSSEGSLGGLVRLGSLEIFEDIMTNAIKNSNSCSRDPLCGDSNPVIAKKEGIQTGIQLSGSNCYSCTLLPETSCQNFNNLLDRWMLQDSNDGFFRNILKDL